MGKLSNISGQEAIKAFERAGWERKYQTGSHIILSKPGVRANLSIPNHKELRPGTLRSLLRSAELTVEEFLALL